MLKKYKRVSDVRQNPKEKNKLELQESWGSITALEKEIQLIPFFWIRRASVWYQSLFLGTCNNDNFHESIFQEA